MMTDEPHERQKTLGLIRVARLSTVAIRPRQSRNEVEEGAAMAKPLEAGCHVE